MEDPGLLKRPASVLAVDRYVKDGMIIGLGTGNAANMAIDRIAEKVNNGMKLTFVSSSIRTEQYAKSKGLRIQPIDSVERIDVTIDGADEIGKDLILIKGLGGALLREKILAKKTDKEIIVADSFKKVDVIGMKTPLPVEVKKENVEITTTELSKLGCIPTLRKRNGSVFITDNSNYILDCKFEYIMEPEKLDKCIKEIENVIETGLFIGLTYSVILYNEDGTVVEIRE